MGKSRDWQVSISFSILFVEALMKIRKKESERGGVVVFNFVFLYFMESSGFLEGTSCLLMMVTFLWVSLVLTEGRKMGY